MICGEIAKRVRFMKVLILQRVKKLGKNKSGGLGTHHSEQQRVGSEVTSIYVVRVHAFYFNVQLLQYSRVTPHIHRIEAALSTLSKFSKFTVDGFDVLLPFFLFFLKAECITSVATSAIHLRLAVSHRIWSTTT